MKSRLPVLLAVLCVAAFVFGSVELFQLRFEAGDVYPPYSSLRADPLGTMAFYESLQRLPGLRVGRDFRPTNLLPEAQDTVYLHLAASTWEWRWLPVEQFKEIETFLRRGGRLVVTFFPETSQPFRFLTPMGDEDDLKTAKPGKRGPQQKKGKEASPARKKKKQSMRPGGEKDMFGSVRLKERWGVEFGFEKLPQSKGDVYEPVLVTNRSARVLPEKLDWHSGAVFTQVAEPWQVIYARGTNAVVIERRFGDGSVVLATDSFFLSNEALRKDRHADLLAWLVGPGHSVVFDEAHFGILEGQGVATLMRKYRLHGCAAGLLMLALLFIWKNSVSFVPPHAETRPQAFVTGKAAAAGFVNLLRRNIRSRDLLEVCHREWKKSVAGNQRFSAERIRQTQAILDTESARPVRERDPLRAYADIHRLVSKSSEFRASSSEINPPTKP
jgi:hypothetical protein